MSDDHARHRGHRSVRLKSYDYSTPGLYFLTTCSDQMECIFSRITDGQAHLTDLGRIVLATWNAIPAHFASTNLHSFIVMPNHVHGILQIARPFSAHGKGKVAISQLPHVTVRSLAAIVRSFKAEVTRRAHAELRWKNKIWQRSYFERIIRDGQEFAETTRYVVENPLHWQWDEENPDRDSSERHPQLGRSMLRPYAQNTAF
jgi:putative transposase